MTIIATQYVRPSGETTHIHITNVKPDDEKFFEENQISISVETLPGTARAAVWGQIPNDQTEYVVLMFQKNIRESLSDLRELLEKMIKKDRKRS